MFNPDKDSLHENISYYHIKTNHFVSEEFTQISELVNQGIQDNVVYPLDFSYYPHSEIQQAFQQLQDPNNLKSVLIQVKIHLLYIYLNIGSRYNWYLNHYSFHNLETLKNKQAVAYLIKSIALKSDIFYISHDRLYLCCKDFEACSLIHIDMYVHPAFGFHSITEVLINKSFEMYTQGQKPKKAGQVLFSTVNF